jgi:hypothetical protein
MRSLLCAMTSLLLATSIAAEEPKKVRKDLLRSKEAIEIWSSDKDATLIIPIQGFHRLLSPATLCPEGRFLAVGVEMDILLFDAQTGKQIDTIPFPHATLLKFENGYLAAFATKSREADEKAWKVPAIGEKIKPYKPDPNAAKKHILLEDDGLVIVDRFKDAEGRRTSIKIPIKGEILTLKKTDDERFFAISLKETVILFHTATGQRLESFPFEEAKHLTFLKGALIADNLKQGPQGVTKALWRIPPK